MDAAIDAPSGLTVTVNLLIERRAGSISIPRSAMILSGGVAQVRVVGSGNIVSERLITYIDWPAEVVIVTSGLKPGDRILVDPNSVQLGQSVRVSG
jgi:HlyD family secretion protein